MQYKCIYCLLELKETLFTLSYTSNNMTGSVHHMAAF